MRAYVSSYPPLIVRVIIAIRKNNVQTPAQWKITLLLYRYKDVKDGYTKCPLIVYNAV
jgi:hypothetical protein